MGKINNKGYALILVVFIVGVVITLTSTMLFALNGEIRLNQGTEEKEKANYLAQGGIEHALMLIEEDSLLSPLPISVDLLIDGSKTYRYTITELTKTKVSATGEIINNYKTEQKITISATIDTAGKVTIEE